MDCSRQNCFTAQCVDKKCQYNAVPNCCGNRICEEARENKCTCPADCGKCQGYGKMTIGTSKREIDTKFLQYLCVNKQCMFTVDKNEVQETNLLNEGNLQYFDIESVITFNNPFDLAKDNFKVKITLKDTDEEVVLPIKIKKIVFKQGEILYAARDLTGKQLSKIGDNIDVLVQPMYELETLEEQKRLTYRLEYEYVITQKDARLPDGTQTYKEVTNREDYENRFTTKITLLRTGLE